MGLGGIVAVNAGSQHEAHFILCRYEPEAAKTTIGLVGRGCYIDTGGNYPKPSENMYMMSVIWAAFCLSALFLRSHCCR